MLARNVSATNGRRWLLRAAEWTGDAAWFRAVLCMQLPCDQYGCSVVEGGGLRGRWSWHAPRVRGL